MFKQKACKLLFSALWANIPRQPLAIMYSRNTHIRVQPKKERGNHFAFSTHAYRINNGNRWDWSCDFTTYKFGEQRFTTTGALAMNLGKFESCVKLNRKATLKWRQLEESKLGFS